mmetsp:Transcript_52659/g.115454  ORF Transcript_52659/g.115454 Transcript_52659/m.115454 type:complete len:498 (+) Transcript_52659:68-1561(+)
MASPEMMKQAQAMMANMSPEQMKQMAEMAAKMDPETMKKMAASSGMGGMPDMSPEQLKQASEQMKNMTPEQMKAQIGAAQNQMSGQRKYYQSAAEMLKTEGNTLVKSGKYQHALAKYEKAESNMQQFKDEEAQKMAVALKGNISLCHLKLGNFRDCQKVCSEILAQDAKNVKALFRRSQAYEQTEEPGKAYRDLRKAAKLSPKDEVLQTAWTKMQKDHPDLKGEPEEPEPVPKKAAPKIEEVTEDTPASSGQMASSASSGAMPAMPPGMPQMTPEAMSAMKDPAMMKSAMSMMEGMDDDTMARMTGQSVDQVKQSRQAMKQMAENPEMMEAATRMMENMPPEQLEAMMKMRQGGMGGAGDDASGGGAGAPPTGMGAMSDPDTVKMAEGFLGSVKPKDIQTMAKTQGIDLKDSHAEMVVKWIPRLLWVWRKVLEGKKFGSFLLFTRNGRVMLAAGVGMLGCMLHFSGCGSGAPSAAEQAAKTAADERAQSLEGKVLQR